MTIKLSDVVRRLPVILLFLGGGAGGPGIGIGIVSDSNQKNVLLHLLSPVQHLSHYQVVWSFHHITTAPYPISDPIWNYPIRDAVLSGLVVLVNGVELYRPSLPTLVHRVALRHRQNFSAQQITLHL